MNQNFYRREIITRFMSPKEFAAFDLMYQSRKSNTASNLPNVTFDDYMNSLADEIETRLKKKKKKFIFDF